MGNSSKEVLKIIEIFKRFEDAFVRSPNSMSGYIPTLHMANAIYDEVIEPLLKEGRDV